MIVFPVKKYYLVIMVNGTGNEYYKYEPTLKHLNSWGFIVEKNDDPSTINGESKLYNILNLNKLNNNIFYNKINIEKMVYQVILKVDMEILELLKNLVN